MKTTSWLVILAVAAGGLMATEAGAQEDRWPLGIAAYMFRGGTLFEAIEKTAELGLEYIEAYPGQLLSEDNPVPLSHEMNEEDRMALKAKLGEEGVRLIAYFWSNGLLEPDVELDWSDEETVRPVFEFAKDMGVEVLTAYPDPDGFDLLEELCEEFGIDIAIHNSGPGSRYDTVGDTLEAVEGRHPRIGACVDLGLVLQSGEIPHEVIEVLGERVKWLHLNDAHISGSETVVGEGDLDLEKTVAALEEAGFDGLVMLEAHFYDEAHLLEDPMPHAKAGLARWRAVLAP